MSSWEHAKWYISGPEFDVWVDASSLATGVSLEHDGAAVEDATWLRKGRDTQHINLVEVDAVLKGVNMVLMGKATRLQLHSDSACVHKCITATLMGKSFWRCPWCTGYRHRKWTRRHEFKSWTRLIAFHIALIPLGKVWIQLFSLQLWVNSRTDWVLQPWWGN